MKCSYCGSDDHPWFNCRKKPEGWKPPKKSTAARKDVRHASQPEAAIEPPAGEAPPVDKFSTDVQDASGAPRQTRRGKGLAGPANAVGARTANTKPAPKRRGRPRTGFDKKAYDAERMKKARLLKKLNAAGVFILPEKL